MSYNSNFNNSNFTNTSNPGHNTWKKVKKFSKIRHDICFCVIFDLFYQRFIFGNEAAH